MKIKETTTLEAVLTNQEADKAVGEAVKAALKYHDTTATGVPEMPGPYTPGPYTMVKESISVSTRGNETLVTITRIRNISA